MGRTQCVCLGEFGLCYFVDIASPVLVVISSAPNEGFHTPFLEPGQRPEITCNLMSFADSDVRSQPIHFSALKTPGVSVRYPLSPTVLLQGIA